LKGKVVPSVYNTGPDDRDYRVLFPQFIQVSFQTVVYAGNDFPFIRIDIINGEEEARLVYDNHIEYLADKNADYIYVGGTLRRSSFVNNCSDVSGLILLINNLTALEPISIAA